MSDQNIKELLEDTQYRGDSLLMIESQGSAHSIYLSTLYNQMIKDISGQDVKEKYGSMAFRDIYEYARKFHDHDVYTSVDYVPLQQDGYVSLELSDTTNYRRYDIKVPITSKPDVSDIEPFLGTVKMTYSTVAITSIDDTNFNGWITPRGQYVDLNRMEERNRIHLSNMFPSDQTGTFKLPVFDNFFKFNIDCNQDNQLTTVFPHQIGIKQHKHDITSGQTFSYTDSTQRVIRCLNAYRDRKGTGEHVESEIAIHGSSHEVSAIDITSNATPFYTPINFTVESTGTDEEPHPNFNYMPVKIYIGQKAQP